MCMDWKTMIRKAVKNSGLTMYAVAKAADVAYPRLHGFMHGGGISLHNAERLAMAVGLELQPVKGKVRK